MTPLEALLSLLKTVLPLLLLTVLTSGQVQFKGRCPQPTVMQGFDDSKADGYKGKWYYYQQYPVKNRQDGMCKRVEYWKLTSVDKYDTTRGPGFGYLENGYWKGGFYALTGKIVPVSKNSEARFNDRFPGRALLSGTANRSLRR